MQWYRLLISAFESYSFQNSNIGFPMDAAEQYCEIAVIYVVYSSHSLGFTLSCCERATLGSLGQDVVYLFTFGHPILRPSPTISAMSKCLGLQLQLRPTSNPVGLCKTGRL